MCLGNRAGISSRYITGQLRTLHENARDCVELHGTGSKPSMSNLEYAMCLAEFYVPAKHGDAISFFAKFGCPQIGFVCNHVVVLSLNLLEGRYAIDYNATTPQQTQLKNIENLTLEFRLSFKRRASGDFTCPDIETRDLYTIGLHVFVMESAEFLLDQVQISSGGSAYSKDQLEALAYYMTEFYLPILKKAGYHTLHSLPDFAASTDIVGVDYSVISTHDLAHAELFGVTVQDVNNGFQELWSKASEFIMSHEFSEDAIGKSFLAEMRTSKSIDGRIINIKLHLGPVQIQALCETEIILYLNIQDIHVYDEGFDGEPREKLRNWRIAFIIDVFEDTLENQTRLVRFDVKNARISEHRSSYSHYYDREILDRVKETVIEEIVPGFFDTFEKEEDIISGYVFPPKDRPFQHPVPPPSYEDSVVDEEFVEKQILQYTDTGSFELITALTQAAINAHFESVWKSEYGATSGAALRQNSAYFSVPHQERAEEVLFEANFSAPEVQLICEEGSHRVIFYLHLLNGKLKPVLTRNSESSSNVHHFSNWRIGFSVDIEVIKTTANAVPSAIRNQFRAGEETQLHQIVLSLSSAQHIPSDIQLLHPEESYRKALLYFVQEYYFPVFESAYHHVLYTMPASVSNMSATSSMFSALKFDIVPFIGSTGSDYREGLVGIHCQRNSIVIRGMATDSQLPEDPVLPGRNWFYNSIGNDPIGTVYLSRKSFLDGVILEITERVNRETTIVPVWKGINNGRWIFKLKKWDSHKAKQGLACNWREMRMEGDVNILEFSWRNKELWNYENDYDGIAIASFHCLTSNNLTVPVGRMDKSGIRISGMVEMRMKYEGKDNAWSSEMSVTWSATVIFASNGSGLEVQLLSAEVQFPQFDTPQGAPGYETQADALRQLRNVFPESIDLTELVGKLKGILEGAWTGVQVQAHEYCVTRPAFNRHGDLLLDLMILETAAGKNGSNQWAASGE